MTYVLGVDGGNSKTLAVLGDGSGSVLGVGRAGCGNHQTAGGVEPAMQHVRVAAEAALDAAGKTANDVAAAFYALAGADLPEDFELLRPALRALALGREIGLDNDSVASLRAGTDNRNAVVVALGHGTVAAGRNAAGREIRLPSLGWYSGDWGGGGDLSKEVIWHSARAHDGRGRPTLLESMVVQALGAADMDELIRKIYLEEIPHDDLRALAPLVFEAAAAGDAVARELIERSGEEAAVNAVALLRRLDIVHVPADVVLAGSVVQAGRPLLVDVARRSLAQLAPRARVMVLDTDPVIGALLCGMDLLRISVGENVHRRAKETYSALTREAAELPSG